MENFIGVIIGAFFIYNLYVYVIRPIVEKLKAAFIKRKIFAFDNSYIEVKHFFVQLFSETPCISYIDHLDAKQVFGFLQDGYAGRVIKIYQRNYFDWQDNGLKFSMTIFHLENNVLVELGHDYAEIVFCANRFGYANGLVEKLKAFKAPEKEQDYEMNIISQTNGEIDLKTLAIKPTQLDLNLYYNDDFLAVDEVIRKRLVTDSDKGIILLHGLPGTGKTTYLRHLIGSINKKVLFISPSVAGNLMNPGLVDLLIDNPNSVLIIEDAENIIMDRKFSSNSSVSNLLNLSDGLLSDCLNVQIICTFNSALSTVDSALLRKGRLIAKYEFDKLRVDKAQRLANHLKQDIVIDKPMTLAEITNPNDKEYKTERVQVIGFRKEVMMN
jgi:ATPase family associated with various cellular activities (AAA)